VFQIGDLVMILVPFLKGASYANSVTRPKGLTGIIIDCNVICLDDSGRNKNSYSVLVEDAITHFWENELELIA
jgi:hypothetical protein